MGLNLFLSFLTFNGIYLTSSLKCHLTGYPWPKECSFLIHERRGTNPACLTATVLDEFDNPLEIRQCSQSGSRELPGGCELLYKRRKVKICSICEKDYCNAPDNFSKGVIFNPTYLLSLNVLWLTCYL